MDSVRRAVLRSPRGSTSLLRGLRGARAHANLHRHEEPASDGWQWNRFQSSKSLDDSSHTIPALEDRRNRAAAAGIHTQNCVYGTRRLPATCRDWTR